MNTRLKVGHRLLNGDQIISALVQYKMLETLVGQVIMDEAISKVSLTQQELFHALVGTTDLEMPEDFEEFLGQWCQQQGVTPDYFNAVVLREVRLEKFKQFYFAQQIESEFLRTKSDLDQVEYSLIQVEDLSLAQELYFQLRDDGADFAQLARYYSLGNEQQTGGWVGPIAVSTLPSKVATLFRGGAVGKIHGPIPTSNQFWIVRLEHYIEARLTEATRALLMQQLYTNWLQSQVNAAVSTPGIIAVQLGEPETT